MIRGVHTKIVRFSLHQAAQEWQLDDKTLASRFKAASIAPDENGYSVQQINRAVFGDLEGDRVRAQTKQAEAAAELKAVKTANLRRENIPAFLVEKVLADLMIELRQKITYTTMPDKDKQDILKDLQAIPVEQFFTAKAEDDGDDE